MKCILMVARFWGNSSMNNNKDREREEEVERKTKSIPDTGQGSSGDLGSDGNVGNEGLTDKDERLKKNTQDSPVPVERKPKTDRDS